MRATTRVLLALLASILSLPLSAQIRDYVPVVRPVFYQETITFLQKLSDSMKKDGYDDAAAVLKAYAAGGFGSGFVIKAQDGSDYVVTNRHVVSQAASVTLEFQKPDGSQVVYKNCPVVAVDENLDLALVAFPNGAKPFAEGLSFAANPVDDGLEVWTAGYPGLGSTPAWQFGTGNVTNAQARVPELADPAITSLIQHSAQVDPGNSGGPLLVADKSAQGGYRVVGVNTWKVVDRQATNFSIPSAAIQGFVAKVLAQKGKTGAQMPQLEARCREFIGAAAKKDDSYKAIARFVAYSYVAQDGEGIIKDVLSVAPTTVRDDILSVFTDVSPIEGIRLAIAYKISTSLASKDGPVPLGFVAVDGDAESSATPVPVRLSRDGKDISLTWVREHGVWRIASYPLQPKNAASAGAAKTGSAVSSVTFDQMPYNGLILTGPDFSLASGGGMLWDVTLLMAPSTYFYWGFSGAAGSASYTSSSLYGGGSTTTNGVQTRFGVDLGGQLPIMTSSLSIIPFLGLQAGIGFNSAAMSDASAGTSTLGLYSLAQGGVQLGFGADPSFYIAAAFESYLFAPSSLTGPCLALRAGLRFM
ncbi:MAG: trypsin-like peptidase domain-containing protein [Treponema sp.]|nr:trypsin-like peptidase domain-containing protein [Treponema sp.]